jgi:hypothetical protein
MSSVSARGYGFRKKSTRMPVGPTEVTYVERRILEIEVGAFGKRREGRCLRIPSLRKKLG